VPRAHGSGGFARRNASIVLYDYERGEKARFNILNAWPSKLSGPSLNANANETAVEELTLAVEKLSREM
jgi:phage tail-like protein